MYIFRFVTINYTQVYVTKSEEIYIQNLNQIQLIHAWRAGMRMAASRSGSRSNTSPSPTPYCLWAVPPRFSCRRLSRALVVASFLRDTLVRAFVNTSPRPSRHPCSTGPSALPTRRRRSWRHPAIARNASRGAGCTKPPTGRARTARRASLQIAGAGRALAGQGSRASCCRARRIAVTAGGKTWRR